MTINTAIFSKYGWFCLLRKMGVTAVGLLLFTGILKAQVVSSDDLLKQALNETNVNRNYPRAIALTQKGIRQSPGYTDLHVLLGRLYMLTNRTAEAHAELDKALKLQPGYPDAINYLVNIELTAGNSNKALAYIDEGLKASPGDRLLSIKKVSVYEEQKNYASASRIIEALLYNEPGDKQLRDLFVNLKLQQGRLDLKQGKKILAKLEFEAVINKVPDNTLALTFLANLAAEEGNYAKAVLYMEDAITFNSPDYDLLFKEAVFLQGDKRFAAAYMITDSLIKTGYSDKKIKQLSVDLHVAEGRRDMLQGMRTMARREFMIGLAMIPDDTDALANLTRLENIEHHFTLALKYINKALKKEPANKDLLQDKAVVLNALNDDQGAYKIIKQLSEKYPRDTSISKLERIQYSRSRLNRVAFNYTNTRFNRGGRLPWNLFSVYYQRDGKAGAIIGRVSYADRSFVHGTQFEVEAYPRFKNSDYSYADLAYSSSPVFPKFRAAYSYFREFKQGWEAEAGLRYQYSARSLVSFATSGGKYFGDYWLNARAFVTPDSGQVAQSYTLTGRRFFGSKDDYLTLIVGTGVSPDDRLRNFQFADRANLKSERVSLGYQRTVWLRHIIGILATYNNQEYMPGSRENEYDIFLSYQLKF